MVLYKTSPSSGGLKYINEKTMQKNLAQLARGRTTISSILDLVKIQF
jgi:hypothetical protein